MPPLICAAFIIVLFRNDLRRPDRGSNALWVPLIWMFLAGSRWVSSWLNMGPTFASASDFSDGSPVDAAVFLSLIVAGCWILSRRKIQWRRLLLDNIWIVIYLAYCLLSMGWSDEPFVLAKRWIKDLGNPIMALVMLTEPQPYEAIGIVLRRLAYLLLPLSVLFIRYYPGLGRSYHADGAPMYVGIGHQKNDLGLMCLVSGIYILWEFLKLRAKSVAGPDAERKITLGLLSLMLVMLLRMSDSQTSFVCLVIAGSLMLLARSPGFRGRPNMIMGLPFGGALLFWAVNEQFKIKDVILGALGRNPTLTNRTEVWETVRRYEVDPTFGAGFMSFWSGERMNAIWEQIGPGINQAHNGYLEQYLNLGYVGVGFIIVIILAGLVKIRRHLAVDASAGILRLSFVAVAILYNFTEASFYGINNMWLMLLLGCLEVPYRGPSAPQHTPQLARRSLKRHFGGYRKPLAASSSRFFVNSQ
jgi:exopolysaccharide production protein ExoQ